MARRTKKSPPPKEDPFKAHRGEKGRFVSGNPGGPGRAPLPVELENLRAIAGVMGPGQWRDLAMAMLKEAQAGDWTARRWLEERSLGDATLSELRKFDAQATAPPAAAPRSEKGIRDLSESVMRDVLTQLQEKIQAGKKLDPDEAALLVKIADSLNAATAVDKTPDLSGLSSKEIEAALLGPGAK